MKSVEQTILDNILIRSELITKLKRKKLNFQDIQVDSRRKTGCIYCTDTVGCDEFIKKYTATKGIKSIERNRNINFVINIKLD